MPPYHEVGLLFDFSGLHMHDDSSHGLCDYDIRRRYRLRVLMLSDKRFTFAA